jgi:thioredoxin 1
MMLIRKTQWLLFSAVLLLSIVACNQADSTPLVENPQPGVQTLPKLVDVGADKCIPCIKMAPILDQLRDDFSGRMDVEFVDAWKRKEEAARYNVQMIPTQIFYAADGKELFRHTGFYGREEILGKWRELGYEFDLKQP